MRTLNRYIGREILVSTLVVGAALVALFSFFGLIQELRDLGKGNYQLSKAIAFVLLNIPGQAYELFPIAALIGTTFALTQLVLNSEYTVIRSSGASLGKIIGALLRIGILIAAGVFLIGEFLTPKSEQLATQSRLSAMNNVVAQQFSSGFWFKDRNNFINVRNLLPDFTMLNVAIYELDPKAGLTRIISARIGRATAAKTWQLEDVTLTSFQPQLVSTQRLTTFEWATGLAPDILNMRQVEPNKLSARSLYYAIEHLAANQQNTTQFEVYLWGKLLHPVTVIAMMFLALPFLYFQQRGGSVGARVSAAIMVGLVFYLLSKLSTHLGLIAGWPPALSAALPMLLSIGLTLAILVRLERR